MILCRPERRPPVGGRSFMNQGESMDTEVFLKEYVLPSEARFNERFRLPLPHIPGLAKVGEFIVQGRMDDTCSTNIIAHYRNADGIRFVEVYKNTENSATGIFIRLVGTMSLVKRGYPFAILDAAVSNVNPVTFAKEDPGTRVAIHLPQAETAMRGLFYDFLSREAAAYAIPTMLHETPALPAFWGKFLSAQLPGIAFDKIAVLRELVWRAYACCCGGVAAREDFDYGPALDQIVFKNARAEQNLFKRMGLSVSAEAQSAFFSILAAAP